MIIILIWQKETDGDSPPRAAAQSAPAPAGWGERRRRIAWREPRPDGRLRPTDRLVIEYLYARIADGRDTTGPVTLNDIFVACGISRRTAQNALRRLELASLVARLWQPQGANIGCRYQLAPVALHTPIRTP